MKLFCLVPSTWFYGFLLDQLKGRVEVSGVISRAVNHFCIYVLYFFQLLA